MATFGKILFLVDTNVTETAANRIWDVYETRQPCAPVRDILGADAIAQAYESQAINTKKWLAQGHKIVGRKIGLTSLAVQKQLGVDQPDYGMLFDFMQIENGGVLQTSEISQPKAEAEIAFILAEDLSGENICLKDLENAIDYAVGAIEIVGSRIANWDIKIADTIADNASSSHFVLGDIRKKLNEVDLVNCQMTMTKNGDLVSSGSGAACMGSPLNAALWLAQTMAKLGQPLQKRDIILAGALGPMCAAIAGDTFVANIEGLGEIAVTFE